MSAVTSSPLVVVLAAGDGTRMRSALPKVLHAVAGRSLLGHVLSAARGAGAGRVAVVVAPDRPKVAAEAHRFASGAEIFEQHERRGTAHAVLQARTAIAAQAQAAPGSAVVVLFGDTPLLRPETIRTLADAIAEGAAVAVTGFEAADPTGYGRLIREGDALRAIREHKDASESERAITLCNGGLMALRAGETLALLDSITPANAQNEYYLTDAVGIACARGLAATFRLLPETEVFGINDRVQLAEAEARLQKRLREAAMRGGATLIDPASVFFSADTIIGQDVTIEPHVVFGPGVRLEDGAIIHAFSHLEGAVVRAGASIGPFGRLRPGAEIGPKAKIGNFVEIKNAAIAEGAKISHLSYIGDAVVGADANIGAGTITCNYDGFRKFETNIGAGAFVGSNSALVAPVTIGAGAYVGSGSVITADVAPDALAVGRGRQVEKPGWAAEFRTRPENVAKRK